ncbi:hypothetical protein HOLleu_14555 [Holothuria leucospilota]|uniref:Sushi domain-containing protein n=1 Tax=Holothuria leucospilota TaxID=206669 RepID=A0A9Q1C7R6_HOLLE|nr:hypothetical protein HOLleu_14555 [Holothuria leucospilota]
MYSLLLHFSALSASPVTSVLTLPRDLSIPAGSSTCVTVTIGSVDNFVREDTRTFQISLSSTFADVVENQGQFFVNVWDNGFISGVSCPTPTVINSSPTSCSTFTTGSVCSYGCDDGFERLFGDASRTCTDLFRWSGSPLFCIPGKQLPYFSTVFTCSSVVSPQQPAQDLPPS